MTPTDPLFSLRVTKKEAELILDSFKVTNDITRNLVLKTAGLVLEIAGEDAVRQAQKLTEGDPRST